MAIITKNIGPDYRPIGDDGFYLKALSSEAEGVVWSKICSNDVEPITNVENCIISPSAVLVGSGYYNPVFDPISYNTNPSSVSITSLVTFITEYPTGVYMTHYTWQSTGYFTSNVVNDAQEFRIVAQGSYSCNQEASSVFIYFQQPIIWGTSSTGVTVDNTFLHSTLTNSQLMPDRSISISFTCASGDYAWFACRNSLGTPIFTNGVLSGGFQLVSSGVIYVNNAGYTDTYQVWRSDYPSLGSINIVVS